MAESATSDVGLGFGLIFGALALAAAAYLLAAPTQLAAAWAFAAAMAAGSVSVAVFHLQ